MLEEILQDPRLGEACRRLSAGGRVKLCRVWGSAAPAVAAALGRLAGVAVLFITAHLDDADEAADDVEVLTGTAAKLFPAWEVDIPGEHINCEVAAERLRLCNLLAQPPETRDGPADFIVTSAMAMLQPVPSPEALASSKLALGRGAQMALEELAGWLVDAGFEHVDQVDQHGEFARRGGIVDVFAPGANQAVRIEFFGDSLGERIASIRLFDLDTQRSTEEIDGCDLISTAADLDAAAGTTTHLLSYLPKETIVCMVAPGEIEHLAGELHRRTSETIAARQEHSGGAWQLIAPDEFFAPGGILGRFAMVEMQIFAAGGEGEAIDLGIRSLQRLSADTGEALDELAELSGRAQVRVYCENPAERKRFEELLADSHSELAGRVHTAIGHVQSGFYWPDRRLVVVGHHEIFGRYRRVRRMRHIRAGRPIASLLDLQKGDFVVHVAHGIAKFDSLRRLERDGHSEEYVTLRFADNAMLHVPVSQINLIQKYIGSRQRRPSLSKLGGTAWSRQKERVCEAVRDMAAGMIRIQAMRQATDGVSYPADGDWQHQFAEEFIYSETEDQITALQDINGDMAATRPMDRLLCGDVGFGKTELAMRAAFKVAEAGKQVAVLVPTTVLAEQHFRTFKERFADYPFEIDVLSRFRTAARQREIIKRLALGQIDILIGTHRLLSKDVAFSDLGLVVIDEEQRFGVEHKERLKSMRATVEVLTMTATPIPRTLHMALLGLRDISSLATGPLDRRAIYTEVRHYDDSFIRQAILRELNREGQVFFVHNRVHNIRSLADRIGSLVEEARVAVAHGQMAEGELARTMLAFVRREIDVLVCTTIIESGLDIQTANTIIIHDADRFGLSELHQLRGRVGRYKHRAYCHLLLPETRPVSRVAAKRLKTIEEFSDLGAGFQIAMRDLEIRGAGNILGAEQSGHIAVVGYEMYCQLLEEAVGNLRGEPPAIRREVHVELGIDAYITASYIPPQRQRMEVYRRLGRCGSVSELRQLSADLADNYGRIPAMVGVLLDLAELRVRAGQCGIESIILMDPDIIFSVRDFSAAKGVFEGAAGSVRLPDERTVYWRPGRAYLEMPTLLNVLLKRLRQARPDV